MHHSFKVVQSAVCLMDSLGPGTVRRYFHLDCTHSHAYRLSASHLTPHISPSLSAFSFPFFFFFSCSPRHLLTLPLDTAASASTVSPPALRRSRRRRRGGGGEPSLAHKESQFPAWPSKRKWIFFKKKKKSPSATDLGPQTRTFRRPQEQTVVGGETRDYSSQKAEKQGA